LQITGTKERKVTSAMGVFLKKITHVRKQYLWAKEKRRTNVIRGRYSKLHCNLGFW
jgi:hypothetical protein